MAVEIVVGPMRQLSAAGRFFAGERAGIEVVSATAPAKLYVLDADRRPVAACVAFEAAGEGRYAGSLELATEEVAAAVEGVRAGKVLPMVAVCEDAGGSQIALGVVALVASAMPGDLQPLPPDIIDPFVRRNEFDSAMEDKADKVEGATAGDFAALDANGNLTDSGKKPSDFATADNIALEAAALSAWDLSPLPAAIQGGTPNIVFASIGYYQWHIGTFGAYSEEHFPTEAAAQAATAVTIAGPDCPTPTGITRAVTAYRLGPDAAANPNRDKPLAPADALEDKLDKSGGTMTGDLVIGEGGEVETVLTIATNSTLYLQDGYGFYYGGKQLVAPGQAGTLALVSQIPGITAETWTFEVDDGQGGTTTVTKRVAVYPAAQTQQGA